MRLSRAALAAFFTFTGVMHFLRPKFFEAIVPPAIEDHKQEVVVISGVAEIAGAALILYPASHRLGRWWLLALLVAVFPANIHMAVNPEQIRGLDMRKFPRWALWARLPLQPLAMLWVWQATRR
ncbi:MAG TPA: DoxX family protein [Solirubrobacterales bacterium]|nr:DoxX family protein [Solirubrobacterales bacterium]